MQENTDQETSFPGREEEALDKTWAGLKFAGAAASRQFYGCLFKNCDFTGAEFRGCRFTDCRFESCNLSLLRLPRTALSNVSFKNSKLTGVNWTEAAWPRVKLPGLLKFDNCVLADSVFLGLHLRETAIVNCRAVGADFREADLSKADLAGTDLAGALFGSTNLAGANLAGARNYAIRPADNVMKGARFSMPEAMALLHCLDIQIV